MTMKSPPRSYANAASSPGHPETEHKPGPLAYSVDRTTSVASIHRHRPSVIAIEEPIIEGSRLSARQSRGSVDTSSASLRPSLASRRPSLAHNVLERISSIASRVSDAPSSASATLESIPASRYDGPVLQGPGKKKRKPRPRNRRHRSSLTRDHGDFLASQAGAIEHQPARIEAVSPLVEAISEGDLEAARKIIADKTYLQEQDIIGKPLHAAALAGHEEIIKQLLDAGDFNINDRDSRERTALYAAKSRGHEAVANLLLARGAKDLSSEESRIAGIELKRWHAYEPQMNTSAYVPPQRQTLEDAEVTAEPDQESDEDSNHVQFPPTSRVESEYEHLYKLEVGSCENIKDMEEAVNKTRVAAQKKGEWVRGPMTLASTIQKELPMKHKHVRFPGFGFEIPIVEFDFTSNRGHRVISPAPTVDKLLYGALGVDSITRGDDPASETTCRWYHIPANHLGWAEDLIKKIYEKRSVKEQQKRDVILRREPFGVDSDPTKPIMLDPRPQARSLRPLCRNMTLDREGNTRMATALNLRIPFVHWETETNRFEMHHVMETVRDSYKHDIDNRDPSQRQIPDLKIIQDFTEWNKNEKLLCAYLYSSLPVHPRRTLDQFYYHMLEDTEHRDQDQVITRYYHNVWKRNHDFPEDDEEHNFAKQASAAPKSTFTLEVVPKSLEPEMTNGYTQAHRRHTLSSNNRMDDEPKNILRSRRNTKVEEPKEKFTEPKEEAHVLMVDQLWLWILDENTIITSFPQNWTHDDDKHQIEGDPQDVLQSIHKYLTLVNRPPLESVYDLAQLIVYKSLATFCNKPTPYGPMQILDVYESAIASVTDEETKLFNKFAAESKETWSQDKITGENRRSPEELYNIDQEIEQLKEIKDIQDELHILSVLLESQIPVLQEASDALGKPAETPEPKPKSSLISQTGRSVQNRIGQTVPYSSEFDFEKLHKMVQEQEVRVKGLKQQAEQANKALNHLLDLKQKQANVSEARSARWTAESTKQQGNIMVLFTLVTIIFAPLSLLATIFSLRVVEFPTTLHMGFVVKYMFVVSIAVIVPLIGLVVYTTRLAIAKVFLRLEQRIATWKWFHPITWERLKETLKKRWEGYDGENVSSDTEVPQTKLEVSRLRFWKSRKKLVEDTEKGS
ncbi:hypothetical protein BKA61DRAFT_10492 [Leptodontidium sp. MPI-SDFR-AT-0119]|nr:hypothetical protein BKA61DRAFT_10492 [Leptodontidium sp. MPI-SDFR-AT-0119]